MCLLPFAFPSPLSPVWNSNTRAGGSAAVLSPYGWSFWWWGQKEPGSFVISLGKWEGESCAIRRLNWSSPKPWILDLEYSFMLLISGMWQKEIQSWPTWGCRFGWPRGSLLWEGELDPQGRILWAREGWRRCWRHSLVCCWGMWLFLSSLGLPSQS